MARKSGDQIAVRPQVGLRPSAALREKLEAAAAQSGRSLAHEAEYQLERALDPAFKTIMRPSSDDRPSVRLIRSLFALFEIVDVDASIQSGSLVRAGLTSAFEALLQEHFPDYKGLLSLSEKDYSADQMDEIRHRMAVIAEQINTAQRKAIYGESPPSRGETLLQTAIRLGIIPSDPAEAAQSFSEAAEAAKMRQENMEDEVFG